MTEKEWLQQLKSGDEVFVTQTHRMPELQKVSKVTKTQIVIDYGRYDERYKKETGRKIGGSVWHSQYLTMPTDSVRESIIMDGLKRKATNMADKVVIPTDRATLEALIAALTPFMKQP